MILTVNSDYFLKNINQLIFVMVKCYVPFEVRTEFLNSIYKSLGFKGLTGLDSSSGNKSDRFPPHD
jgi:hypothetical protein